MRRPTQLILLFYFFSLTTSSPLFCQIESTSRVTLDSSSISLEKMNVLKLQNLLDSAYYKINEEQLLDSDNFISLYKSHIAKSTINNLQQRRHLSCYLNYVEGIKYIKTNELNKAKNSFDSITIKLKNQDLNKQDFKLLKRARLFLADINKTRGNYNDAIEQIKILYKPTPYYSSYLAGLYLSIMNIDSARHYYDLTKVKLDDKKLTDIRKLKPLTINTIVARYLGIARFYRQQKDYIKALNTLKDSERYIITEDSLNREQLNFEYAKTYLLKNDYEQTFFYLNQSLQISKGFHKVKKHPNYSRRELLFADLYQTQNDLNQALLHCQHALIDLIAEFDEPTVSANPELKNIQYKKHLLEILGKKAHCLNVRKKAGGP